MKKEQKKFIIKNYSWKTFFIFFVLGSLFGTYYEEILWYIKYHEWTSREGLIFSPLSPIYGLGVLFYILLLGKKNEERSILKTFLYSYLIGGFSEYLTSFIADVIFGVKFWDYSNKFLNIGGRTSLIYMIAWGIMGTILMKIIYHFLCKYLKKIPYVIGNIIYYLIFILVLLDVLITYTAFGRMALRNANIEPFTIVGEIYDKYFSNEFMYQKFPIMKPSEEHSSEEISDDWEKDTLIGHSFFGIDEISYTGSKEAFLIGYDKGIRTFEVDLGLTKDEKLVLIHDWSIFNTFSSIPTEEEFLKTKILNKYTTLSLTDLLNLMEEYQNIFIVTDSKYTEEESIKKEFQYLVNKAKELGKEKILNRFIIQIYNENMYDIVEEIYPFKNIIFTLYQRWNGSDYLDFENIVKWSKEKNIKGITMWNYLYNDTIKEIITRYNINIYVHTENDINKAKEFLKNGVTGIYTDFIGEKDLEE